MSYFICLYLINDTMVFFPTAAAVIIPRGNSTALC